MSAPLPGSPEWSSKVTASKVAAILGLSPWESPYSMWLKMRGDIPSDDGTNQAAKSRGHYLESGVLAWWRDQHAIGEGLGLEQHYAEAEGWAAATPDLYVYTEGGLDSQVAVVDAKTAASDDDWGDEPPAYYLAQAVWQMWVCDADVAYIAVLFGRPQLGFREYRIERDAGLEAQIVAQCRDFYDSLHMDVAPDLDDTVATYEAVRAMHPDVAPKGSDAEFAEVSADTAIDVVQWQDSYKEAERKLRAAKARLLDEMGHARLATAANGRVIARRQPRGDAVSLVITAKPTDVAKTEAV